MSDFSIKETTTIKVPLLQLDGTFGPISEKLLFITQLGKNFVQHEVCENILDPVKTI